MLPVTTTHHLSVSHVDVFPGFLICFGPSLMRLPRVRIHIHTYILHCTTCTVFQGRRISPRRIMVWAAGGRDDSFQLSTQRSSGSSSVISCRIDEPSDSSTGHRSRCRCFLSPHFPRLASRWRQVGIGCFTRAFVSFIFFFPSNVREKNLAAPPFNRLDAMPP